MPEFHAPYNFVPVTGKVNGRKTPKTQWPDLTADKAGAVRHDHWPSGLHHGRIVCKLTLETPTVVGCLQEGKKDESKRVIPYEVNGQYAIPGSSLRGMIGAVAETLSQSALRVLREREMSVRKPMDEAISAIGLLAGQPGKADWELWPLTVGSLKANGSPRFKLDELDDLDDLDGLAKLSEEVFTQIEGRERRWKDVLPVYLSEGFVENRSKLMVWGRNSKEENMSERVPANSFDARNPVYYYARLLGSEQAVSTHLFANARNYKLKEEDNVYTLLGQKMEGDYLLTQRRYSSLPEEEKKLYTRGGLFVFGTAGRNLPSGKKFEYFVPIPEDAADYAVCVPGPVRQTYEKLHDLVKRRQPKLPLPFCLSGYEDATLQPGRLCRYELADVDDGIEVGEISYSAIWRRLIDGSVHDFFRKIDPDLLPWHPGREALTPAEALFGVVDSDKEEGEKISRNLASRLRFSDATALPQTPARLQPEVPLKILSSPKLPAPTMYFRPDTGAAPIAKTRLCLKEHRPNGRKVYLHHPERQIEGKEWISPPSEKADKQKLRVTPLEKGQSFWFHIDFDNLTDAELTLLLASLRPGDDFRHRLGLGKPLGLGSVAIELAGTFLIDRQKRYAEFDLDAPRYHAVIAGGAEAQEPGDWKAAYPREAGALSDESLHREPLSAPSLIDDNTLSILRALGNRNKLKPGVPVRYPVAEGQTGEEEGFKWFVNNEDVITHGTWTGSPPAQALAAVAPEKPSLPTLHSVGTRPKKKENGVQ